MSATELSPSDYVAEMVGALSTVAADAAGHDLRPCYLQVNHNALDDLLHGQPWHVNVQLDDEAAVDKLAEFYSLPADDGEGRVYDRAGIVATGAGELHVNLYCGRPKDRITLIREWVAANYSDESKRLVEEGAEATPEDQAKFAQAEAAGLFTKATR